LLGLADKIALLSLPQFICRIIFWHISSIQAKVKRKQIFNTSNIPLKRVDETVPIDFC